MATAFLCTCALNVNVGCTDVSHVFSGHDPVWILVFVLLCTLFLGFRQKSCPERGSIVLAGFLAALTYLGKGVSSTKSVTFLQPTAVNLSVALICISGFWYLYAYLINSLMQKLDLSVEQASPNPPDTPRANDTKYFLKTQGLLVLLWSPYLIAALPGNISYDATWQLAMGEGLIPFTTHHPPFTTLIYTALFDAGNALAGVAGGGFLLFAFQVIIYSGAFAYCSLWMRKIETPRSVRFFALAFWAFVPAFPSFAQMIMKDTLACCTFVLFALQIIIRLLSAAHSTRMPRFASAPAFILVGTLCCLTRNESVFVVIPTLFVLCIVERKDRRTLLQLACCSVAVLFIWSLWSICLLPALGIASGNSREALSIPILQTARCLRDFPEDIAAEERQVLEEITTVPLDDFAARYNPNNSDSTKDRFDVSESDDVTSRYFDVWASMGMRHPETYLTVLLESTEGYWYPFTPDAVQDYTPERGQPTVVDASYLETNDMIDTWNDLFGNTGSAWADGFFRYMNKAVYFARSTPVLDLLSAPATYVWIEAFLLLYLLRQRNAVCIMACPLFLKLLTCMASPLSGSMRYALPLAACVPLLLAAAFAFKPRQEHEPTKPKNRESTRETNAIKDRDIENLRCLVKIDAANNRQPCIALGMFRLSRFLVAERSYAPCSPTP